MSFLLMTHQDFQVSLEEYKVHLLYLLVHWVFAGSSIIIHISETLYEVCEDVRELHKHVMHQKKNR